jgi:hypothetical protein
MVTVEAVKKDIGALSTEEHLVAIDTVFSVDKLFKAVTADRFYCLQCASHSLVAIDL